MQLRVEVSMWGDDEVNGNHTIASFDDIDKLAAQVGRAVKRWARQIPLRKAGARTEIRLDATWTEREAKARKAKE